MVVAGPGTGKTQISSREGIDWNAFLVVQSNDATPVEFKLSRAAAKQSALLNGMLEDTSEGEETVVPVPNVNAATLKYVIQYLEYHKDAKADTIDKPLKGDLKEIISQWDKDFLYGDLIKGGDEKQHDILVDVVMAANFLDIKDLLDLCCAAIANMIKGKTPEQLKELFQIERDFTPEEEAKIREENRWCEES
jgi:S-phase kinase-associated protein 1